VTDNNVILMHASCVAIDGAGVLLRGASGAGKSDLALRLIDEGATLVADDQVVIKSRDGCLVGDAPEILRGKLEVRGVGIVPVTPSGPVPVRLLVDLVAAADVERMPGEQSCDIAGVRVRRIALYAFEPSAPAKLRLILGSITGSG
jgi:serine kinase of HPr protein (carbohydrate metabolism regulator)